MGRGKQFEGSCASVLLEAATLLLLSPTPKDPAVRLISIDLKSLKLNLPLPDVELILTVEIVNPNIVPIHYSDTTMSIFYDGALLGTAHIEAGSQPRRSSQVLWLPARLEGGEMANHAKKLFSDVLKREMVMDAEVVIEGGAKVLMWNHRFKVHVESHITVDPLFLDVIHQENKSRLEIPIV